MKKRTIGRILSAAAVLTLGGVGYSAAARRRNPYYDGPRSDHFDGVRFFRHRQAADKGLLDLASWILGGNREPWPKTCPSPFHDTPPERVEGLRVSFVGHATVLVQVAGLNILIDPVWSRRVSPFRFVGPVRKNKPGIDFDALPPIDVVLISHNHYDHLDIRTVKRLWRHFRPRILAPLGNDGVIRSHDDGIAVTTLDWGDSVEEGAVRIHLTPANHWSSRGINDRYMALWGAFVLETPAGLLYLAGDTGYGEGETFRDVRERFGPPRLAVLPIGAYEPRWFMEAQHMSPDDAVKAMLDLEADEAIGIHWGTFPLANEGFDSPIHDLGISLSERGIPLDRFVAMRPGQVWEPEAE